MNGRRAVVVLAACCVALAAAGSAASLTPLPGIRSPSGNIRCLYVPSTTGAAPNLLCDIGRAVYTEQLQAQCMAPNGTGVDWHGFELGATRKGAVLCSGGILYDPGTQRPTYVTLPYGKSWHRGPFTCWSRIGGVTCKNTRGHGLFIARESWRVW